MEKIPAKDLPVGTVIANDRVAFIKNEMDLGLGQENWSSTAGSAYSDYEIAEYLVQELWVQLDGESRILRRGKNA